MIYDVWLKGSVDNFCRQSYPSSDHKRELICQEFAKLKKLCIVEPSSGSYMPFCSPALLIAKSDNSACLETDFGILNSSCVISFPHLDEHLTRIGEMSSHFFGSILLIGQSLSQQIRVNCIITYTCLRAFITQLTAYVFCHLDFHICYADDVALLGSSKNSTLKNS